MADKMIVMLTKHGFGDPVLCAVCKQAVNNVWAVNWTAARYGAGVCDDCRDKGGLPPENTVNLAITPPILQPPAEG